MCLNIWAYTKLVGGSWLSLMVLLPSFDANAQDIEKSLFSSENMLFLWMKLGRRHLSTESWKKLGWLKNAAFIGKYLKFWVLHIINEKKGWMMTNMNNGHCIIVIVSICQLVYNEGNTLSKNIFEQDWRHIFPSSFFMANAVLQSLLHQIQSFSGC